MCTLFENKLQQLQVVKTELPEILFYQTFFNKFATLV